MQALVVFLWILGGAWCGYLIGGVLAEVTLPALERLRQWHNDWLWARQRAHAAVYVVSPEVLKAMQESGRELGISALEAAQAFHRMGRCGLSLSAGKDVSL